MDKQRAPSLMVFVDGTNFHIACRENYGLKIDIAKLKSHLMSGYHFNRLFYYTSSLPTNSRDRDRFQREQRFFAELRQMHGVTLFTGYHERHVRKIKGKRLLTDEEVTIEHEYHVEKRTDVKLAVDMVHCALNTQLGHTYDVAMLVSNDTDFVPAVELVQALGKKVVWCRLDRHSSASDLAKCCHQTLVLSAADLRACERST